MDTLDLNWKKKDQLDASKYLCKINYFPINLGLYNSTQTTQPTMDLRKIISAL